jgi:fermentation-respiration switch protein FrsA (DUF1100 family)
MKPVGYFSYWRSRFKSGEVKKDVVDAILYLLGGYLAFVLGMAVFQRHLMYYPSDSWAYSPAESHAEAVSYQTADHLVLRSWYAPPKNGNPVFVLFHGNAGNISDRAFKQKYFAEHGYGFLLAEYRGYGGNPGKPSEAGFYNDGRAAISWLMHEKKINENRIVIFGESIGCGVASQMAVEFKGAKALVLEAPFTSAIDEAGDVYPWLGPFKYLTLDRYDNISKAAHFEMPVLIINGTDDKVIPPKHGKTLYNAVASKIKQHELLKGGGHNNLAEFGLLLQIENFISGIYK